MITEAEPTKTELETSETGWFPSSPLPGRFQYNDKVLKASYRILASFRPFYSKTAKKGNFQGLFFQGKRSSLVICRTCFFNFFMDEDVAGKRFYKNPCKELTASLNIKTVLIQDCFFIFTPKTFPRRLVPLRSSPGDQAGGAVRILTCCPSEWIYKLQQTQ